ncbi:cytochrome P450 [Pseudonocardia sp. CA-107938]|uniref:cytochrome P450 n=1 Tax=Pseudonocardia sp. CA-107938 TaxID=3240021 RepID=UPI003D8D4DA7
MTDRPADELLAWHEDVAVAGAREPVRFVEPLGAWFVHGHADVDRVLTEYALFSSDELRHSAQDVPHRDNPVLRTLVATDPPRHHVLRRIVSRAFTPRSVAAVEQRIVATAHGLLAGSRDELDVVVDLAHPLPIATISALLGVEAERQADFVRWAEAITSFAGAFATDPARRTAFVSAFAELGDYFRDVIEEHRRSPADDVIGALVAAEPDGTALSTDELVDFCALLLINGHETTRTLIVHTLLCLQRDPALLRRLRADPELVPAVVEEVLRLLPPIGGTDRFTTATTSIGGHTVEAGTRVVGMVVSANRDPRVFVRPHDLVPGRDPNPHLSFGHGVHFCLGAHLARCEVRAAVDAALARMPGEWWLPPDRFTTRRTPVGIDVTGMALKWGG